MFSPAQVKVLEAIVDTFIPRLSPEEENKIYQEIYPKKDIYELSEDQIKDMCRISASSFQLTQGLLNGIDKKLSPTSLGGIGRILDLLNSKAGTCLLTGHWGLFTEFDQPTKEGIMMKWKTSSFETFRILFTIFSGLTYAVGYNLNNSPLPKCFGYDGAGEDKYFVNHPKYEPVHHERLPMMSLEEATQKELTFDVVVIGSGAGGGVAAAELAAAGYSVLVIEKGKYYHQTEFLHQEEKLSELFDSNTIVLAANGVISSASGSLFGGGTAINYGASLKIQHFVREEWAKLGLKHFITPEFEADNNRVMERIGASTDNFPDTKIRAKFFEGCKQLGYPGVSCTSNTGGKVHNCSRCIMGCRSGVKNSTANTWLKDAFQCGARFLDRSKVTRVIISKGKAVGVECRVHDSHTIKIKASRVISACGSLRTPDLLKKSGLTNSHIGKNLRLQPFSFAFGVFDETIKQSEGPVLTCLSTVADNWNGDYYGAKVEDVSLVPGTFAASLPWMGSAEHKKMMLKYNAVGTFLNIIRDKDSVGSVEINEYDKIILNYKLSPHDNKSLLEGAKRGVMILVASGAREIYSSLSCIKPFKFNDDEESRVDNKRFVQWIDTFKTTIQTGCSDLSTVHQLGSCRMGISPKSSVVQSTGETWETKHLYVADGSVLPTAVGVNPMVTIEAVALSTARSVIQSLKQTPKL